MLIGRVPQVGALLEAETNTVSDPERRGSLRLNQRSLLEEFGVEALVDIVLVSRVAVGLKSRDEGLEPWSEDDELSGVRGGCVGVGDARGNEDGGSGTGGFGAVGVAEGELAFEHVPGFIVGVVDVEGGRTAAAPLVDAEGIAGGGEAGRLHAIVLDGGKISTRLRRRTYARAARACKI
jgi:hypothetical protein